MGWGGVGWIELIQDKDQWWALVNTVMNLWVSKNVVKLLSNWTAGGFSRRAQLHEVNVKSVHLVFEVIVILYCVILYYRSWSIS
jgi:hypothetical protein